MNVTAIEDVKDEDLRRAYSEVFASEAGKRVIYDVLSICGMYSAVFTGENNATNFLLGKQEVGKSVIDRLNSVDERLYPQLLLAIADQREVAKITAQAVSKGVEDDDIDA